MLEVHVHRIRHELNSYCCAVRSVKLFVSQETLKMVYYVYFQVQKNIIRTTTGCGSRDSCRDLFNNTKMLSLQSQCIPSFLLFVVNNKNKFKLNSEVPYINTRQKFTFHQSSSNLSPY